MIPAIIGAVVVVLGAAGYIAGNRHYRTHFLPGTFINGVGVSNQTLEAAEQRVADKENAYTLTITFRNGETAELSADDFHMEFINDGSVQTLLDDQLKDGLWFTKVAGQKNLSVAESYSVDEDAAKEAILSLDAFQEENMTAPQDAAITLDGSTYTVTEADPGTQIKVDEAAAAIIDAAKNLDEDIDLDEEGLYVSIENPVDVSTLQAQADAANAMLTSNITYQMAGKTYTVNGDVLKDWITINEDGTAALDETQVRKWVDQMAHETDTFGLAHTFTTHSGAVIQLAGGGDYGWAMNEDATTADLIEMIKAGTQNDNAEAKYQYSAMDRGENDIGNTYVEISITEQKMWCYKDGQLVVETDIVSGNESAGLATPSGCVWAIDGKVSPRHFKSTNVDVDFWLPFNGGVGLHNATWRSSYGGTIYQTNGSHGCINTPYDAMSTIYQTMEIGYPVIVYYSVDQVVGPQPTGEVSGG